MSSRTSSRWGVGREQEGPIRPMHPFREVMAVSTHHAVKHFKAQRHAASQLEAATLRYESAIGDRCVLGKGMHDHLGRSLVIDTRHFEPIHYLFIGGLRAGQSDRAQYNEDRDDRAQGRQRHSCFHGSIHRAKRHDPSLGLLPCKLAHNGRRVNRFRLPASSPRTA